MILNLQKKLKEQDLISNYNTICLKIQREVSKTNFPPSYLNPTKPNLKYFELLK
jgi:hypothetical protein